MRKTRENKGFTMVEMLLVVGIIAVLAAVAFVSVIYYLRSMTKLEYDGYAKSIFVASQNHLTMAAHEGYLGQTAFGTPETGDNTGVYYIVVEDGAEDGSSMLPLLLPDGAVDGTVRAGSYIIRYHKDTARVLDVFFWSTGGRFKYSYTSSDYSDLLANKDKKSTMRSYGAARSVIGWFGGEDADLKASGEELQAPMIVVSNAERLTVTVTDTNSSISSARLKLIIKGEISGEMKEITLSSATTPGVVYDSSSNTYTVTLDDITSDSLRFSEQFSGFTPGENITVQAVAYSDSTEQLYNIAYSAEQTTNSLFADGSGSGTALIGNIRHLENLDASVSGLAVSISDAKQITDLSWTDFLGVVGESASVYYGSTSTSAGCYYPISPSYVIRYDGQGHSISDVTVNYSGPAGLFGTVTAGSTIQDLRLVDFTVRSTGGNAGALAGTLAGSGTTVSNVLAIHSDGKESCSISASGSAGGLIGDAGSNTVEYSAAALIVSGGTNAGGLIGTVSGGTITGCYAGGHTSGGAYSSESFNVTATGSAGGLIGSSAGAAITAGYSTCSASGATAGGLVGTASSGSISNCYSTGLVSGTTAGAFAGSSAVTPSGCQYFSIINWGMDAVGSGAAAEVSAFDDTMEHYFAFADDSPASAVPYDPTILGSYLGKYNLKSVASLSGTDVSSKFVSVHYGDWPVPEIFFVNEPTS